MSSKVREFTDRLSYAAGSYHQQRQQEQHRQLPPRASVKVPQPDVVLHSDSDPSLLSINRPAAADVRFLSLEPPRGLTGYRSHAHGGPHGFLDGMRRAASMEQMPGCERVIFRAEDVPVVDAMAHETARVTEPLREQVRGGMAFKVGVSSAFATVCMHPFTNAVITMQRQNFALPQANAFTMRGVGPAAMRSGMLWGVQHTFAMGLDTVWGGTSVGKASDGDGTRAPSVKANCLAAATATALLAPLDNMHQLCLSGYSPAKIGQTFLDQPTRAFRGVGVSAAFFYTSMFQRNLDHMVAEYSETQPGRLAAMGGVTVVMGMVNTFLGTVKSRQQGEDEGLRDSSRRVLQLVRTNPRGFAVNVAMSTALLTGNTVVYWVAHSALCGEDKTK